MAPVDSIETGSTHCVCWEVRSAGLVLLNTAGDDYKLTPTLCPVNVGPASYPFNPSQYFILRYLHVCFLLLLFVLDFIYIYIHSTYNIQYRRKENKTIRKGPCKVKTIPDIQKNFG